MPIPVIATPYSTAVKVSTIWLPLPSVTGKSPKMATLARMLPAMTIIAHTLLSMPVDRPLRIVVAGPVWVLRAMSCTGGCSVSVK